MTWQSQLNSLTGWTSGIVISVIGMMGLAALTIVAERDHVGATNKELLAYVLAFPDLHAELCADFVPGGVRQVGMEADRA